MVVTRAEAILYTILKRASRAPKGCRFKATRDITLALVALAESGLIDAQDDGRIAITAIGLTVLQLLATRNKQEAKRVGFRPRRKAHRPLH